MIMGCWCNVLRGRFSRLRNTVAPEQTVGSDRGSDTRVGADRDINYGKCMDLRGKGHRGGSGWHGTEYVR
jgi:hypothetical protein